MSPSIRAARVTARVAFLALGLLAASGRVRAAISFVEPRALPLVVDGGVNGGVYVVAKGDFDGDGRLDVAATAAGLVPGGDPHVEHDFVAVLSGNGDGTFQAPVVVDLGLRGSAAPGGLAAADLDGDGVLDLATIAQRTREVLVLLGRGDGTFGDPTPFETGATALTDLRLADLDGDGHLDLVAVSIMADASAGQLAVLKGDGAGGFGSPAVRSVGRLPHGLAVADVDGHSGPDVLVTCFYGTSGAGTLEVLLNDGHGGFPASAITYPARTNATGLWVADYDGDGKPDALVPGRGGPYGCGIGCVHLLRGDGGGGFAAPTAEDAWEAEGWVQAVYSENGPLDLDGDLRPDALFTHINGGNEVTTFLAAPEGGRATAEWVASPGSGLHAGELDRLDDGSTLGLAAGDFDGDGAPDLVVATQKTAARAGGLSYVPGVTGAPGTFRAPRVLATDRMWGGNIYAGAERGIAVAPLTADGAADLLFTADALALFAGAGDGTFAAPATALARWTGAGDFLSVADLDEDGALDAVWLGSGTPLVALGEGDGTFTALTGLPPQTSGYGARNFAIADVDGDGLLDVVSLTLWVGSVIPYHAQVVETWRSVLPESPPFAPAGSVVLQPGALAKSSNGLVAADLDGDGRADVVGHRFNDPGGDDLVLFRGNADGSLGPAEVIASELAQPIGNLLAGDLDGDARPDLVALGSWGGAHVLIGHGDGTFGTVAGYPACEGPVDGRLLDVDGDARLDLVVACVNGLAVLPGAGDGTFGPPRRFAIGVTGAHSLAPGDLDGDRRPDLVVGHGSSANFRHLTVLRNDSGPAADLALSGAVVPAALHAGEVATVTLTVANEGPDASGAVALRSPLRRGVDLVSTSAASGACAPAAGAVSCTLDSVASGGNASVVLRLRAAAEGTHWITASVSGATPDPNAANDAASLAVAAAAQAADLRVALTASPEPVVAGEPLTYAATVVNDGPSLATGATLAVAPPEGATFVSATASRGACAFSAGSGVTCALGSLDAGEGATARVVVTVGAAGSLSARATVASGVLDPHAEDDVATASSTATAVPAPPAPPSDSGKGCGCGASGAGGLAAPALLLLAALSRPRPRPRAAPARVRG